VVELKYPVDLVNISDEFVHRGVWVRPFGRLVYIMPPYIIEQHDLAHLTQAVCEVISDMDPSSILNW
jgi:adenosylmethionine-8-amino-7-oxononanoate aminotransferase